MRVSFHPSILLLALPFFFSACEKSTDWALKTTEEPRLVIEAILTNEDRIQEIYLSGIFSELNGEAPPVTDAVVRVTVSGVAFAFEPDPQRPGRYLSQFPFAVISGLDYALEVEWNGQTYTAASRLSDVSSLPAPFFVPINNTDSLILGDFIPPFSTVEQAMYRIDIDWAHLVDSAEVTQARLYYYTFNSIDMSQLIPPPRQVVRFPRGSVVTIKKFGLNDDFAEYLRAKAIETDWSGTFFFSVSDNLPTNIRGGALGFFSTCAVLSQSLIAQ